MCPAHVRGVRRPQIVEQDVLLDPYSIQESSQAAPQEEHQTGPVERGQAHAERAAGLVVPAGHHLAGRRRARLAEVRDDAFVSLPSGYGLRQITDRLCAAAGFTPRIVASAGWHAAARLIAIGLGVALAPQSTATQLGQDPSIVAKTLKATPTRELRLITPPRAHRTAAERDLEANLREAADGMRRGP